jgi:hypothetical protein
LQLVSPPTLTPPLVTAEGANLHTEPLYQDSSCASAEAAPAAPAAAAAAVTNNGGAQGVGVGAHHASSASAPAPAHAADPGHAHTLLQQLMARMEGGAGNQAEDMQVCVSVCLCVFMCASV